MEGFKSDITCMPSSAKLLVTFRTPWTTYLDDYNSSVNDII